MKKLAFTTTLLLGLLISFYPLFHSSMSETIWDQSDSRFIHYILEHFYQVFSSLWTTGTNTAALLSPPMFYPTAGTLAYSDLLIGAAPIYAFFRWVSLSPESSFQGWMMICQILNFISFFLLLNKVLKFRFGPSLIGAFVFAFARIRLAQMGHMQLILQYYSVFSICSFILWTRTKRYRFIIVSFVFFGLQLITSFYYAWFLSLGISILLLFLCVHRETRSQLFSSVTRNWLPLVLGTVAFLCVLGPFLPAILTAKKEIGPRAFEEVATMLPRLSSWLYYGPESFLYGFFSKWIGSELPMQHEHRLGFGLVTLTIAFMGTYQYFKLRSSLIFRLICLVSLFLFVWSLQVGDYTLWRTIHFTYPGGRSIRSVTRIGLWLFVPLIIGLSYTLTSHWLKLRNYYYLILALIALEQFAIIPHYPKYEPFYRAKQIAALVPQKCRSFFYSPIRDLSGPHQSHLDAMWASLLNGIPTINGYSGGQPRFWEELYSHRITDPIEKIRIETELKNWATRHHVEFNPECWIQF